MDSDAADKIRKLLERQRETVSADRRDFRISKNIASGSGITDESRKAYGSDRAIVNVPVLDPAVNSVCSRYDSSPFSFAMPKGLESLFDGRELTAALSRSLREICWDGLSYMLVYHSGGRIRFRVLDNLNTVFGPCRLAGGEDCKEALYIDKISEKEIKKQYPDFYLENGSIADFCGAERASGEYEEATYWEKTDSGVKVSKLIGGRLADEAEMPLRRIPIVRVCGKKVWLDGRENWRGIPYPVRDLLTTLTYCASLLQERIATAPSFNFWVAQESASDHETVQQMLKMNGLPRATGFYRALGEGGLALPPPQRVDKSAGIEELSAHIGNITQTINTIVGVAGAAPLAGTETAESVLLRRESKENATDEFLRNLLSGAQGMADLAAEFFAMLGAALPGGIAVSESIFEKAKQQSDSQKLIAFVGFLGQNPQGMDFAETMLEALDLGGETKENAGRALLALRQKEQAGIAQMQQQMAQNAQMLQQAEAQKQEMQQQIAGLQKQLQDSQYMNFEMESDSRARILIEEMKLKNDIAKKQMDIQMDREKLALEYAKLGLKADADSAKIGIETAKAENSAAKAAAQLAAEQTKRIDAAFEEAQEHPTDLGFR